VRAFLWAIGAGAGGGGAGLLGGTHCVMLAVRSAGAGGSSGGAGTAGVAGDSSVCDTACCCESAAEAGRVLEKGCMCGKNTEGERRRSWVPVPSVTVRTDRL
jgi:hypothetical protein